MELLARLALTYLVHSTVLLTAAALVCLALRERRLALQEAVLRAALVGGFVTASLQLGLGVRPMAGTVALPGPQPTQAYAAEASPLVPPPSIDGVPGVIVGETVTRPPAEPSLPSWAVFLPDSGLDLWPGWRPVLFGAWIVLAILALVRLAVAAARLRALLRDRRPIQSHEMAPAAARLAEALGLRRPVPLSAAPRLTVPLATGVLRPEVCLPTRAVSEMPAEEQVALCAHELAHVARRDPAWILAARLIEAGAPVQPLNVWARRRLQDLAECLSDDLAVDAAGQRLGLARSLVDVASWLGDGSLLPAAAAGALSVKSRLGHRVERLMDPLRIPERPRPSFLIVAGLCVLATTLVTPVVSGSSTPIEEPKPAPRAKPAPQPPAAPQPEAQPEPAPDPQPKAKPQAAEAATPRPDAEPSADARRELDELAGRIEARARLSEEETARLKAEIDALTAKVRPNEAEVERLSREIAENAAEISATIAEGVGQGIDETAHREKCRELQQHMSELRQQIRDSVRSGIRDEDMRAIRDRARELAERTRPTAEEMERIRELSHRLARESMPDAREMTRLSREASDQLRDAMQQVREAMRTLRDEMRRAGREMGRSLRSMDKEPGSSDKTPEPPEKAPGSTPKPD